MLERGAEIEIEKSHFRVHRLEIAELKKLSKNVNRTAVTKNKNGDDFPWTFLACGIDTLDLGVGVSWERNWSKLSQELEIAKRDASGSSGRQWRELDGQMSLTLPSAKPPMYRYHFQTAIGHFFLAKSENPENKTPNVYISFDAASLWCKGLAYCIQSLGRIIRELGGKILSIKPSRCDLCADYHIPGGLGLDFLRAYAVSYAHKRRHFEDSGILETYYVGDPDNPVQLRIYDKAREVVAGGTKVWFMNVWGVQELCDVWRVEFQLRRPLLQLFTINTIGRLRWRLAALWQYLTEDWASLRLPDDSNTSRRTVHSWWQDVQACAVRLGEISVLVRRVRSFDPASADWYVAHIAGCAVSYGALRGHVSWPGVWQELTERVNAKRTEAQYNLALEVQRIKKGQVGLPIKGQYPDSWDEIDLVDAPSAAGDGGQVDA